MASTKDVLDHHLKCFGEGDLEGILADYSSDAVLFMPNGPLKGPDAIKPVFRLCFQSLHSLALRSLCTSSTSRVITPIFYGTQKQQTIATMPRPTHLLCGTEKS
jgi:hypothetical protein